MHTPKKKQDFRKVYEYEIRLQQSEKWQIRKYNDRWFQGTIKYSKESTKDI